MAQRHRQRSGLGKLLEGRGYRPFQAGGGISLHGSASAARSCDLFNLGKSGISLTGGDRRSLTPAGNVAENNHIHHFGIFQRTYAPGIGVNGCGQIASNNCIHDAPHNAVLNNLVVDCPIGLHIDARGMTWKQWNSPSDKSWSLEEKALRLNYTQPPWSTRYPRLAAIMNDAPRQPLGNTIRRNVLVNCTKRVCDFDGNVKKLLDKFEIADNLAVNTTGPPRALRNAPAGL